MYPLLSLLPIFYTLFAMIILRQPSKKVLPQALLATMLIAFAYWQVSPDHLFAYAFFGSLKAFDIIVIVFGALLIFNTLEHSGAMLVIGGSFNRITSDHRLLLLIGYALVQLIEGAAGFGTPAAIVAPILIGLGVPPMAAVCFALMADSTGVSFGAVGTPLIGINSALNLEPELLQAVGVKTALLTSAGGLVTPLLALALVMRFFSDQPWRWRDFLEVLPFGLLTVLFFLLPFNLLAHLVGYETPTIVAGAIALILTVMLAKSGWLRPRHVWRFPAQQQAKSAPLHMQISSFRAWLPYALIVLVLILTRIPALGLNGLLKAQRLTLPRVLGVEGLDYHFLWAYLPGTIPFTMVALLAIPLLRMNRTMIRLSWHDTFTQLKGATVALISGVAMVQVMLNSANPDLNLGSMVEEIARVLVRLPAVLFVFFAPIIGVLGAFMSGSNTVSNILFAPLQAEAAHAYGFQPAVLLAMQNIGGSIGNMIAINNVLAALAVSGLLASRHSQQGGLEGQIIKINTIPVLVYSLLTSLLALLFLYV